MDIRPLFDFEYRLKCLLSNASPDDKDLFDPFEWNEILRSVNISETEARLRKVITDLPQLSPDQLQAELNEILAVLSKQPS